MTDQNLTPEAVEKCCSYLEAEHHNRSEELTAAKILRALAQQNAELQDKVEQLEHENSGLRGLLSEMQVLFPGGQNYRGLKARVRAALTNGESHD